MTVLNFPTDDRDVLALCERAGDRLVLHLSRYGIVCAPSSVPELCESLVRHRSTRKAMP